MAVTGLAMFRDRFAAHQDKYVLIGGCAASTTLEQAGIAARATKDLDIVLVVEAIDPEFGRMFWQFIEEGGYAFRQQSTEGRRPTFYRFSKPAATGFPFMIELFGRAPVLARPLHDGAHLTPIPFDEEVSSLSAILLDDDYYRFVLDGRRTIDNLPFIGEDRLIPLKALAWMELRDRKDQGGQVDEKHIGKHLADVFALAQLLDPGAPVEIGGRVEEDLRRFLERVAQVDTLRYGGPSPQLISRINQGFGLAVPAVAG